MDVGGHGGPARRVAQRRGALGVVLLTLLASAFVVVVGIATHRPDPDAQGPSCPSLVAWVTGERRTGCEDALGAMIPPMVLASVISIGLVAAVDAIFTSRRRLLDRDEDVADEPRAVPPRA